MRERESARNRADLCCEEANMLMHLKLIARTAPISRMHSPTAASSWRGECSHLIGVCVRCHALVMSPQSSSVQSRSLNGLSHGCSGRGL